MKLSDLKPASQCAHNFGVKILMYGPPGAGKTRLIHTAPNPVFISAEPSLASMRDAGHIPCIMATDVKTIDDVFKWVFQSNEVKNFDTICPDSLTEIANIYLEHELSKTTSAGNKAHGQAAYGEMARKVMTIANGLFYMQNKHVYITAKELVDDEGDKKIKKPLFPGNVLKAEIPHLYDEILRIDFYKGVPGFPQAVQAIRTCEDFAIRARDKHGKLMPYEPPDLANIINKCLS